MRRPPVVRRFLHGRPWIKESYEAYCHSPGFPSEKLVVRVDRYRDRTEITGCMMDVDEELRSSPMRARNLGAAEWTDFAEKVEAGFWQQPPTDTAQRVMDGVSWSIAGFRRGQYRKVSRHTGSLQAGTGTETFALGAWMVRAAGLKRHGYNDSAGADVESPPGGAGTS